MFSVYDLGERYQSELADHSRRSSGTHYTPSGLARWVTQIALDPLVFRGMAQGVPAAQDSLRSPEEILKLRIIDTACGCGAFLFTAAQYLAMRLCKSEAIQAGDQSMSAASWLPGRADTSGQCDQESEPAWFTQRLPGAFSRVLRNCIYGIDIDPYAITLARSLAWITSQPSAQLLRTLSAHIICADALREEWFEVDAFAEIMGQGGFDGAIGNPPFLGAQKMRSALGAEYRNYLVKTIARGKKGAADLSAYFLLRNNAILQPAGTFGLITTNTISQGDTREVGLEQVVGSGTTLYHATKSLQWSGTAAVSVSVIHGFKGQYQGTKWLTH